jgi:hypothetical protein
MEMTNSTHWEADPGLLLSHVNALLHAHYFHYGEGRAGEVLRHLMALLGTGRHADVLQLVQQQHLVDLLCQALKRALKNIFLYLQQQELPNGLELSTQQLTEVVAVLLPPATNGVGQTQPLPLCCERANLQRQVRLQYFKELSHESMMHVFPACASSIDFG